MTISKALISSLLLCLLFLHIVEADQMVKISSTSGAGSTPPEKIDCGASCTTRCQLSSRPHLCNRACGTCCARCNCVPPGTYGNYETCPCYANMTTHGNRRKCP
ncbi:snakin-2-like [Cornus florida]|uniref:snakin-2-like n=1 Tax=Cornus florida TaxID=4283 RepID=UPI0028A1E42B|nr:snakin-2-like [Cornus florida]